MSELTYQVPPRLRRPFRVGEVVAICDREGISMSRFVVAKVGPKVVRLRGDNRSFRATDGWWIGERRVWPFPSLRQLRKSEHVEMVQNMLMMVFSKWPSKREISQWSDIERDAVENWAANEILRASDNPVRVPKRPSLLDQWANLGFDGKPLT